MDIERNEKWREKNKGFLEGMEDNRIALNKAYEKKIKIELFNDHFQNYKRYHIPKAQLVIADIPYNLGVNAYASLFKNANT